jgi:AcrR family transcriptional regulator
MEIERSEGSKTRDRIIRVAERLFAENGFAGTSVREITNEAGVNVAAVNYHFGGKEALYQQTFRRLLNELRHIRIRRIRADMKEAGENAALEDFLLSFAHAFVEPLVANGRGQLFMALFDHEMHQPRVPTGVFLRDLVGPMLRITEESLRRVGIEIDRATTGLCMMSLVGQLIHGVKVHQRMLEDPESAGFPVDLTSLLNHIVTFSAAGIRARAAAADSEGAGRGKEIHA